MDNLFLFHKDMFSLLLILSLVTFTHAWPNDEFVVFGYGAQGFGLKDDSQAFVDAWRDACNAETPTAKVIVPAQATFFLNPVMFIGPCKPLSIHFVILGRIVAPNSPTAWDGLDPSQWIGFKNITGLKVYGPGLIDGQGKGWWDQSCKYHRDLPGCTKLAPTAMKFLSCEKSSLSNMYFVNSPQTHILIKNCNGFNVDRVMIQAPGNSPNTDGIHIHSSHFVYITNSKIGTGDDCISIGDRLSDIDIAKIACGPGHGISIGSLGKGGSNVLVENIHVRDSLFKGTTNGARIKTWQAGTGNVRRVTFENLIFDDVKNPLIIDQNYCDVRGACKEMSTGVHISDVVYKNFYGTSSTNIAINLNCSRSVPCTAINMENINLESAQPGNTVIASCTNAKGREVGVAPGPCFRN